MLAAKLGGTSAGRGQSIPSAPVGRPEQRGRQVDTCTKASLPPPITMHLDCQGPPVTYSDATSRSPQRTVVSSELPVYDVRLKIAAHEKEKEAARATLDRIRRQEWDEQATLKKQKERKLRRIWQRDARHRLEKEGAWRQEEYNHEWRASGACPDPITDPLGWCEYEWSKKERNKSPAWAGDLWSASPMDHQQLAMRMVCSWGLVKAYQWTRQSTYICPLAPHIMEAYNHKVNHDSHKELHPQEHTVLQYACMLQYVSFCNERYKDHLAPAVKAFWSKVVEPFGSRALHNLDLSHILGSAMHPNRGAKIPDYGVQDHIVQVCAPFF